MTADSRVDPRPDATSDLTESLQGTAGHSNQNSSPKAEPVNDHQRQEKFDELVAELGEVKNLVEQFSSIIAGIVGLARVEVLLAIRTIPRLFLIWLMMIPLILLTWISFSTLVSWLVYSLTSAVAAGLFIFFLLQLALIATAGWLFDLYRKRMSLPNTRSQLKELIKGIKHEFSDRNKT